MFHCKNLKRGLKCSREWYLVAVNSLSAPSFALLFCKHPPPTPSLLFKSKKFTQTKPLLQQINHLCVLFRFHLQRKLKLCERGRKAIENKLRKERGGSVCVTNRKDTPLDQRSGVVSFWSIIFLHKIIQGKQTNSLLFFTKNKEKHSLWRKTKRLLQS